MSSASGSSMHGLPVAVDSDATRRYETSSASRGPRRRGSRAKPGGASASRRSKSAPKASVGRKVKSTSMNRDAVASFSPNRVAVKKGQEVQRLENAIKHLGEVHQSMSARATYEMAEQQLRIESARSELEQARLDAAGMSASAQTAVQHARTEAVKGVHNLEATVSMKLALSEEEIARKHDEELRRVEMEHQARLRSALLTSEKEKGQLEHHAEQVHAEHQSRLRHVLHGVERERDELKQSVEIAHAKAAQVSDAVQRTSSQALQQQVLAAEAALAEQRRIVEAERANERREWQIEAARRDNEALMLREQLAQMHSMMEAMRLQVAAGAPPPPPPLPVASCAAAAVNSQPNISTVKAMQLQVAAGAPPPPPPLPASSCTVAAANSQPNASVCPSSNYANPPPGIPVPMGHAASSMPYPGGGGGGGEPDGHVRHGHESSEGSDDPDSSGDDGAGRRRSRRPGGKREAAVITLNPLPTGAAGFRRWRTDALRDIAGAASKPRSAYRWLACVSDVSIRDSQLNRPGARFESLDGKMLTALGKIVTAHPFLQRKLHSYYESQSELTSGRVTLRRIFEYYGTDADMNGVYSVSDFMQCTLGGTGEDSLERFYEMWVWIETGLSEPVAENIRESLLWTQLRGSVLMQAEINRYRLAPRGHPDHSYEFLLGALQRHVQLYRQEKNREDFLRGLQSAAGGQQKALPVSEHDGLAAQANKGKRVCWQYQKGSCTRANCQFLHEKRSDSSEGKGKSLEKSGESSDGKGRQLSSTTPTCRYFAQKGKCQFGDKCKYRHAPREGLVAVDTPSGLETSAFVAELLRPPTPPPSESCDGSASVQFHVQCEPCNDDSKNVASGCVSEIETCAVAGTSVACSASNVQVDGSHRRWIIDSGAGLDLISGGEIHESELSTMSKCGCIRKLRTANGMINAEHTVTCHIAEFGHDVSALVLDKCPPVLSLGRRIVQGYSFEWDSTSGARLRTPSGKVISLRVENHVPILDECSSVALCKEDHVETSACPSGSQEGNVEECEHEEVDCDDDHDVTPEGGAGTSRGEYMRNGRRKEAVGTRLHDLTHFPKNRYCKICREVLKVSTPAKRIVPGQETLRADSFGQVIHLDHVFSGSECHGVNGETCALVILDQCTGFICTYPMSERSGPNVVVAIRHFIGESIPLAEVKVRADNAKEYEYATRTLGLAWYRSTPHRHQSNGKIERCIRSVCEMTRCALSQSGLQHGHWPYAMEHASLMRNIHVPYHTHGQTPWLARFGEDFKWEIWPFGASMRALIKGDKQGKFEPGSREALFLGYEFAPGHVHADYRVATLPTDSSDGYGTQVLNIRRTVDIVIEGEVVYPASSGHEGVKDCIIRYVPASEADDRTLKMLHEGLIDESGILTDAQKERGWTVHRFGERLVKTPPRSTRPPDWTPEDWRSLPMAVRKAFTELHKEKLDAQAASGSNGIVCTVKKGVSFEGEASGGGRSVTLSELMSGDIHDIKGDDVQRIVIELCCESDSLIGRRSPQGTLVVRVTQKDDLCEPKHVRQLAILIQKAKHPVLLWVSVPCTTGCTWLRTTPHLKDDPQHQKKVAYDRCLANNALTLVRCAHDSKRVVCWEWPRHTDLWKVGVHDELKSIGLETCDVDGCAFNLRIKGELVKKPWRVMSNSVSMIRGLSGRTCTGGHQHVQCRGVVARESASYSCEMVDCIHHGFMEDIRSREGPVALIKAAARQRGPQNDADDIDGRVCAAHANALLNVKLSGVEVNANSCELEEMEKEERTIEVVLQELEDLLNARSIPCAPQRTNVARDGDVVRSVLLGAYTRRGRGVTGACLQGKWLPVLQLVHEAAKLRGAHRRNAPYSAIQINHTSPQGMVSHVDQNNVGHSDIIALGDYTGGKLYVSGVELPCHRKWAVLDGQQSHEVSAVQGRRWSIVLHTPKGMEKMSRKTTERLRSLGFPDHDVDAAQGGKLGLERVVEPSREDGVASGNCEGVNAEPEAACLVDEGVHREHDSITGNGWGAFITRQIWPHEKLRMSSRPQG
eukprot:5945300-Amphidinium_carterae.2